MNIKELEEAKRQLECDIQQAIASRIEKFALDTGYHPARISIDFADCFSLSHERLRAVIEGVSVDLGVRL